MARVNLESRVKGGRNDGRGRVNARYLVVGQFDGLIVFGDPQQLGESVSEHSAVSPQVLLTRRFHNGT